MSEWHTHDVDLTPSGLKGYEGQKVIRLPCANPNCEIARLKEELAALAKAIIDKDDENFVPHDDTPIVAMARRALEGGKK